MAIAAGAMALLRTMTRGALRQTKHLSPWKSKLSYSSKGNPLKDKTGKNRLTSFTMKKGITSGGQLRPWAQTTLSGMKKVGFSKGARTKALYGYSRGTKHIAKHKKLYGSALGGAAAWDILDRDD
jgi:hypothetical protein